MAKPHRRLIVFVHLPVPGTVKSRLIPTLGAKGATELYRRLVLRTFRAALNACAGTDLQLEIRFNGGDANTFHNWLGEGFLCRPQAEGDLGHRMARAFDDSFAEGSTGTIIIECNCPELTPARITAAFERLALANVVFGQAFDGGYYLIGLTKPVPALFKDIPWGTETVLADSKRILVQEHMVPAILEPLRDLDVPEDLREWQWRIGSEEGNPQRVSVIIPALNEAENIEATLQAVRAGKPHEIILADGGSTDHTRSIAEAAGATVVQSKPGRARQMNAAAARATGNVLLFLHADTLLPDDWSGVVQKTIAPTEVAAGALTLRIGESFFGRGLVQWLASLRSRWFQNPQGGQTLFLRRALFEELGGFADLPIMEDAEFNHRLRQRGRIVTAPAAALTSGRRWKKLGVIRTTLINKLVKTGYGLGVSPIRLARFYHR